MSVVQTIDIQIQSEGTEFLLTDKTLSDSLNPSNNWSAGSPNSNAAKSAITSVLFNITSSNSMTPATIIETSNWFIRTNETRVLTLTDLGFTSTTIPDGLYYIRTCPFVSLGASVTANEGGDSVTLLSGNNEAFLAAGYTHILVGSTIHEVDIEASIGAGTKIFLVEPFDNISGKYAASGGYYNLTEYCNSYNTEAQAAVKLASVDLCNCSTRCSEQLMKLWDTWQVMNIQKQVDSHTEAEDTRQIFYRQILSSNCNGC